jgi:exosortase B
VTVYELQTEIWVQDAGSQGPIAVLLSLWLFWHKLREPEVRGMLAVPEGNLGLGLIWFLPGLLLFTLARSQSIMLLVTLALIPMLVGVSIALLGSRVTRACWFCFFFILFVVPLPIAVVDAITQPLKLGVSWATEKLLYSAGYPIAREGVVLHLWPYKLLVADACAGLHSLFTLEALGLFYLNVVRHESALRNTLMAIFIIPVSFMSNVLRVVVLALITFHVSDSAGQGFAHDFAGLALFVLALLLIIGADGLARRISRALGR